MIDVANIKNEKLKKICDNLEEKFFFFKKHDKLTKLLES